MDFPFYKVQLVDYLMFDFSSMFIDLNHFYGAMLCIIAEFQLVN